MTKDKLGIVSSSRTQTFHLSAEAKTEDRSKWVLINDWLLRIETIGRSTDKQLISSHLQKPKRFAIVCMCIFCCFRCVSQLTRSYCTEGASVKLVLKFEKNIPSLQVINKQSFQVSWIIFLHFSYVWIRWIYRHEYWQRNIPACPVPRRKSAISRAWFILLSARCELHAARAANLFTITHLYSALCHIIIYLILQRRKYWLEEIWRA